MSKTITIQHKIIHRKMVVDCPLMVTSKVKPVVRPDETRKEE